MREIALVTCRALPDLDADDQALLGPLTELGYRASPQVWDDPGVDWARFDLAVLRSTWDYTDRREAFVSWAASVTRLENDADTVAWNTDKHYLADLEAAGVPVVPTTWLVPTEGLKLPEGGHHVLKPAVGAGSIDAGRFDLSNANSRREAAAHAERLLSAGKSVLVQPFMTAVETAGETGVVLVDGQFSHATRKGPMLRPELEQVDGLYLEEDVTPRSASKVEIDLALMALDAFRRIRGKRAVPLYARVDMVPGADGAPLLMELELTEPSLFMETAPGAAQRFAEAIAARARLGIASRT